jgi:hypothetical protein
VPKGVLDAVFMLAARPAWGVILRVFSESAIIVVLGVFSESIVIENMFGS